MRDFGYAQARMQARYGAYPSEAVWLQLAPAKEMASYLEGARATGLAPWVANLSSVSDVHDIEHSVRGSLATCIQEVAVWVPEPWRPSVRWLLWLAYLPALRYLLEGGPVLRWMEEGHRLKPYLHPETEARRWAIVQDEGGPLVDAWDQGRPMESAWLEVWRQRWPRCAARRVAPLGRLVGLFEAHRQQFGSLRPEQGWAARQSLRQAVQHFFRRHLLHPAAAFAYLALVALDLERLRAELTRRVLFSPAGGHS